MSNFVGRIKDGWASLPDPRKKSNRLTYTMEEVALSAFAVFFMQSPSFLSHQRDMEQKKRSNNARKLFKIEKIPCKQQVRNILDHVKPAEISADFFWLINELKQTGHLESYTSFEKTKAIALDGLTYHSSTEIHCDCCSTRRDKQGTVHYYHHALMPVIVKPECPQVLALPPEFIVPQDGHEKQDCERAASKRWLTKHQENFTPFTITYLGDDLYSNQPLCQQIADEAKQYFLFVCKPDSHKTLYEELALLAKVENGVETRQIRHWNGRSHELWTYRWASQLPLRLGDDALHVNWCELHITNEKSGDILFHNAWITNHQLTFENVMDACQLGRTRWKVENEAINILKNQGYHLEHNFGHGDQYLSSTLFTLNLLAFLAHTALYLANTQYQLIRDELVKRTTFFDDLRALTRYMLFDSWEHLFAFMIDWLEIDPITI
ncbi:MAG: ISNCY family transposase [Moorea sp. SIO1G6]|nr:ISNCY family transposase [Moorena sp. SIO1G6]